MTENRLTDLARMHIYPDRLSNVSDIRVIHIFSLNQPRRLEPKRLHDFGRKYNFFFLSYQRIFFNFFLKQDSLKFILYMLRTPSLHSLTKSCYSLTLVPGVKTNDKFYLLHLLVYYIYN